MEIPHNRYAEESVLARCINNTEDNPFDLASKFLSAADFYIEGHQEIWTAMESLADSNTPIDFVTVGDKTKSNDELFATVLNLSTTQTTSISFKEHILIVLEQSKLRTLRLEYMKGIERVESNESSDAIIDDVNKELDRFKPSNEDSSHIENSLEAIKEEYEQMASGLYKHEYIKTHLTHLDNKIKLELGCVFTIAAPTSVGKSALSLNIALRCASKDNFPTLIFSLEMPQKQISKRMIGSLSKVDLARIEEGVASQADRDKVNESIDKLKSIPLHTVHSVKNVASIASDVRRYKREKGIKLVVIDYLQLIPFDSNRMGKADGIAMISQKIKQIALENNVAIILLSQLNREGARSDKPDLYHLKDSGSIENDADIVLIMNCKENDPELAKCTDKFGPYMHINYLIAKNREGERGVRDYFKFYYKQGRFF
jgi:replicative DNA helicase